MTAFGVWCEPYWSARFGHRSSTWLKAMGEERTFDTLEAATAEADRLNASEFAQYASYSARER